MQVKVLILNKYKDTPESLEKRLRLVVQESEFAVQDMRAAENPYNSDIYFTVTFAGPKRASQDVCVLAWITVDQAEAVLNSTLENIVANHATARCLNLVATSKSPRMLAAFIVERASSENAEVQNKKETTTEKQDSSEASQSKQGRQRKARS